MSIRPNTEGRRSGRGATGRRIRDGYGNRGQSLFGRGSSGHVRHSFGGVDHLSGYRDLRGSRRHGSGIARFFEPTYSRYGYCRPYRHHHHRVARRHHRGSYYGGSIGFGFSTGYPRYSSYYGYPSSLTLFDPAPLETNIYSTTVYEAQPYAVDPSGEVYIEQDAYAGGGGYAPVIAAAPADVIITTPPSATVTPAEPAPSDTAAAGGPKEDTYTLVDEGNIAFNAGDYESAIRLYVAAVLVDDTDAFARLFYGLAQFAIGDYELAAVGMRRALTLDPELITSPIDLRSIYPDLETFDEQLKRLVVGVSENPKNEDVVFLLGYVYYATADPASAVALLQTAVDLDPTDELALAVRDRAAEVLAETAIATE